MTHDKCTHVLSELFRFEMHHRANTQVPQLTLGRESITLPTARRAETPARCARKVRPHEKHLLCLDPRASGYARLQCEQRSAQSKGDLVLQSRSGLRAPE